MKATVFEFTSYSYNSPKGELSLTYTITFEDSEPLIFIEKVQFPHTITIDASLHKLLERTFEQVHLMLGISYYKTYFAPRIEIPYKLTKEQANFWSKLYKNGLGEFLYRNNLDPEIVATFPSYNTHIVPLQIATKSESILVGLGGGKDSIVVTELLREAGHKPEIGRAHV